MVRGFSDANAGRSVAGPAELGRSAAENRKCFMSLTPGDNPRLGPTRFADWLERRTLGLRAAARTSYKPEAPASGSPGRCTRGRFGLL
jgi:hypothetical protein